MRRGARGGACASRARFVHRQRSPLERLIVEAAHRVLGSARALNSTKANPRGLPVSRSVASERYASGPMAAKCARNSASVTSYGRFPTKRRRAIPYWKRNKKVAVHPCRALTHFFAFFHAVRLMGT